MADPGRTRAGWILRRVVGLPTGVHVLGFRRAASASANGRVFRRPPAHPGFDLALSRPALARSDRDVAALRRAVLACTGGVFSTVALALVGSGSRAFGGGLSASGIHAAGHDLERHIDAGGLARRL